MARRLSLLMVVLALSCGRERTPTQPSTSEPPRLIAVLGDSLSVSPSPDESFPAVLQRRLATDRPGWMVLNAGMNGDTTADGLARLNTVLARRPQILILALGANDGLRGVPVERIHAQLTAIIERSQAASAQVLLAGMETPPLRGFDYSLAFRGIYPELARRFDVPLVPFHWPVWWPTLISTNRIWSTRTETAHVASPKTSGPISSRCCRERHRQRYGEVTSVAWRAPWCPPPMSARLARVQRVLEDDVRRRIAKTFDDRSEPLARRLREGVRDVDACPARWRQVGSAPART